MIYSTNLLILDTTRVEVIGKYLDKIIETVAQKPDGISQAEAALIGAAIGASAAILAQLIIFSLTKYKERNNLMRELISEERRIAYLLTEFYKELVMHKVHKQYWYRTSELRKDNKDDSKDSHDRHFLSNQRSFETMTRIRVTTSEYFKTLTHFTNLAGENQIITQLLKEIKSFKPRKASTFDSVSDYQSLVVAVETEEVELNNVYLFYSNCFDKINGQMIK